MFSAESVRFSHTRESGAWAESRYWGQVVLFGLAIWLLVPVSIMVGMTPAAFAVILLQVSGGLSCVAESLVVEAIIAKVNGDVITRSEIERDFRALARGPRWPGTVPRSEHVLRDWIDHLLLLQKGCETGIRVDSEVSKQLAAIQERENIVDSERFRDFVREHSGIPYEDFKDQLRDRILRERVLQELVGQQVAIPTSDVQKYYEEHKSEFVRTEQVILSEIFLSTESSTDEEIATIRKKANDLSARARRGEPFAELARQYSDSRTREHSGELGGFQKEALDQEIPTLVWDQHRGFVTDPISRSEPAGFLILRVDEKHKAGQASMEEARNEIMERLYLSRFQSGLRVLLTRLRKEAFLEIKPGYIDTGAALGKNTAWTEPTELKPATITKGEMASRVVRRRLFGIFPLPGAGVTRDMKPGTSTSR